MPETETPERVEVLTEPLTYDRNAPTSFFRDLALSEQGNMVAGDRLVRHRNEMRVELPKLESRARTATAGHGIQYRANPNAGTSTLAPPLWLIEDFATAPRAKRVLANLVQRFPLPAGAHSINLPRLTTGTAEQSHADNTPVSGTDIVDAQSQSIVTTFSGQADTSLQLLEQSPAGAHLDFVLFKDMAEGYDAQLEAQLINGSGVGENLQGILQAIPSGNAVTYTDASPTGSELFPLLGQAIARVGNNRKAPPEAWLLTTSRWGWLGSQEDTAGLPLILADWGPKGQGILAISAEFDDAIPVTLGAGANQDAIIACRPSDIMLWEGEQRTSVNFESLSGTLQARFQFHASVAAVVRYPTGQAAVQGTGLIVQSGF